jgi:tripartite-type tricarboxylate transporter receptor subunit TctC
MMAKTDILRLVFMVVAGAASVNALADYPDHPIRMIVEFPAGGNVDIVARRIGLKLTERLGKQIVVDNRGGAGGVIAHEYAAKSAPDGYTLLLATTAFTANPALHKKLPYDPLADFVPIALAADWGGFLVVHPSIPANTLADFVKLIKANPNRLSYSSAGTGTWPHLSMEMFKSMAGIKIVHVPYKGVVPALQDVIAGYVAAKIDSYATSMPHIKSGRLKLIAVTTAQRLPQVPDTPTIAEQGYPGYDSAIWLGLVTSKGTPKDIVSRLEQNVVAIIKDREFARKLDEDGFRPLGGRGSDLDALIRKELAQWQRVVRETGISPLD